MPYYIMWKWFGLLVLILWSLVVLCLVAFKIRREGLFVFSRRNWTESGLTMLITLLPKERRPIYIPIMILTPIVGLLAILWR